MSEELEAIDTYFFQLVLSLQAGAMQQMGKFASPMTGQIERNLDVAQATIDTLAMLETKTRGNLSPQESRLISRLLYELRLNFVDEKKKDETAATQKPESNNAAGTIKENEPTDDGGTARG